MDILIFTIFSYILGSIPFALIITKYAGHGDIREIGSGNIGTANAFRTGSKLIGIATFIGDTAKGFLAVLLACYFIPDASLYALIAVVLGHTFSLFLGFKGGKGVATSLGGFLAIHPILGIIAIGVWIIFGIIFHYSSLSSIAAMTATMVYAILTMPPQQSIIFILLAILVTYCHRDNIQRLVKGEERKITLFAKNNRE